MDKATILDAIREQAEANGGVPVGRGRFEALTGIRETDWAGRYWARWGDAVREAGYEPNTLKQPQSDDALFTALASLTRDLGHLPTSREMALRRRVDPSFPSHNVYARFGRKADVAARLLEHCGTNPGLDDVAIICRSIVTKQAPEAEEASSDDGPVPGEVYLMKSGQHYKIGRSNAAGRRAYELAIQLPERLEMVHVIRTDDAIGIERYWHQRYEAKRLNGEWFALSTADVAAFKRRKTM